MEYIWRLEKSGGLSIDIANIKRLEMKEDPAEEMKKGETVK